MGGVFGTVTKKSSTEAFQNQRTDESPRNEKSPPEHGGIGDDATMFNSLDDAGETQVVVSRTTSIATDAGVPAPQDIVVVETCCACNHSVKWVAFAEKLEEAAERVGTTEEEPHFVTKENDGDVTWGTLEQWDKLLKPQEDLAILSEQTAQPAFEFYKQEQPASSWSKFSISRDDARK